MSDVLIRRDGAVGRLTLNRPAALHALTLPMCEAMAGALLAWAKDPDVAMVLIDHTGDRGFCAGGDIRMLARSGAGDGSEARAFFFKEYQLNALLMAYPKPVAAAMDGVVMGGGVGLSLPCRHRIATERTLFAMPETGIGLFPDVGGGWHLPRLPGESGMWLALTGARIKAADCLLLGVSTHTVASGALEALKADLSADPEAAESLIGARAAPREAAPLADHLQSIDRAFGAPSVEAILEALTQDGSEFALEQARLLRTKSPQTLKLAFRQLRQGAGLSSFAQNMAMEYRLGCRVVHRHDFQEGVRAVILDKDNAPRWSPARLEDVDDAMLDALFSPLAVGAEWRPVEIG